MPRPLHRYGTPRGDFMPFLRGNRHSLSEYGRAHMLTGVVIAKWLLRRTRRFHSDQLLKLPRLARLMRGAHLQPASMRAWVGEYLSAWEEPSSRHSFFANELLERFPRLEHKVKTLWEGW